MSDYGKRGGTSANAGRKATTYVGKFPDGRSFRKRSFAVSTPKAYVGVYEIGGVWYAAGVAIDTVMMNGALRPIYHEGALPADGQVAIVAQRV